MIAAGIDAGTVSYSIVALKDGKIVYHEELETSEVRRSPELIVDCIEESGAVIAAGLSGYGMPVKRFSQLDEVDIFLMTLNFDRDRSLGLRRIVEIVRERDLNLYTIPGVIHLPTVPAWRKMNRIDIGTADKLCSAVLAVAKLSEDMHRSRLNFVLAEVGHFNAFIAVRHGRIVDGIGGSSGFPGYGAVGSIDAELAYLVGEFPKSLIFSGGVRSFAEDSGRDGYADVLAEFVLKGIRAAEVSVGRAEFVVLSGRYASDVRKYVEEHYDVKPLWGFGRGKQSAQGAAIIANAIAGGEYREVVEYMQIFAAKGTVLDYITSDIMLHLRRGMERRAED